MPCYVEPRTLSSRPGQPGQPSQPSRPGQATCQLPCILRTRPKHPWNKPKTFSKHPKTLPKPPQISEHSNLGHKNGQSEKKIVFCQGFHRSWTPFWPTKGPKRGPRAFQKLLKSALKREKIDIEK